MSSEDELDGFGGGAGFGDTAVTSSGFGVGAGAAGSLDTDSEDDLGGLTGFGTSSAPSDGVAARAIRREELTASLADVETKLAAERAELAGIMEKELHATPHQCRRSMRAMSGLFEEEDGDDDDEEEGGGGGAAAAAGGAPRRPLSGGFTGPIPEEVDAYYGIEKHRQQKHRAHVIQELLHTEREYITDLEIIVDMFMGPLMSDPTVRQKVSELSFEDIFSNVADIKAVATQFLAGLEEAVGPTLSFDSNVGATFFADEEIASGFLKYCVYCSNHTAADDALAMVQYDSQVRHKLELCRMMVVEKQRKAGNGGRRVQGRGIPLEGFLLAPIQRICKYPLLLNELLKATPEDHPDHADVAKAAQDMKKLADTINEDKRNAEQLPMIQDSIGGWSGPDLIETSSVHLHDGALWKISGGKCQERHFFLFDNLLIYAKRGLRGGYVLKGRIATDILEVVPIPDGKYDGHTVSFAMRISNSKRGKKYIVYCRSLQEKQGWLAKFKDERERVKQAVSQGRDHRKKGRLGDVTMTSAEKKWRKKKQGASHKGKMGSKSRSRSGSGSGTTSFDDDEGLLVAKEGMRTIENVKIVEVHCGISSDSLEYAWKSTQLAPISYNALVQWTLDSFLLSHLDPRDFQLVQRRDAQDPQKDKLLPRSAAEAADVNTGNTTTIPLYAMDKEGPEPYLIYLLYSIGDEEAEDLEV